ncbi:MAG: hypothetical protein VX899_20035 [Myxococcota bacterium]|nr:hypothetical protein [Myxococcota bacterium]
MTLLILMLACGRNRTAPQDCDPELGLAQSEQPSFDEEVRLRLELSRCTDDTCFDARAWREDPSTGEVTPGPALDLDLAWGSLGELQHDGSVSTWRVTPPHNGELAVTVRDDTRGLSLRRTALVFDTVAESWDQPLAVEGLVNTCGWEDGAALTPDGAFLFVHYLPVSIDCLVRPGRRFCRTAVGPVSAPERPDMPGAERVDESGRIHHGCPTTGLDPMPVPVPPNSLYVFARQDDGSYAEPAVLQFEGLDGCVAPWGPTFLPDEGSSATGTLVVSVDDPYDDPPSIPEWAPLTLGQTQTLATWEKEAGNASRTSSLLESVGLQVPGGQAGNPHLSADRSQLWFDDEADTDTIYVTALDSDLQATGQPQRLPSEVFSGHESQPYFDGERLYFRQDVTLMVAEYLGGDFDQASAWGTPTPVIAVEDRGEAGSMAGAGEPTIAEIDGAAVLSFVYVIRREDGSLDLNLGQVAARD